MAKKIDIQVKAKGAKKAGQDLGKVDSRLKSLAKSAGLAAAGFFGGRALLSGFKEAIRLAGIQEQEEKKLEVALGRTSNALLKHASALQQVTTFGDESIIAVQASIAAFVKNEEQIKAATEATLDISVAMGMDLKAAGDLVAKTLGSSMNAMSRYGIQVEGAVGSTERLESLTNNVAKLFGGQAKAQTETMAGAMTQAENATGDLAEAIGEKLSPVVISTSKKIKELSEGLIEILDVTDTEKAQANFNELNNIMGRMTKIQNEINEAQEKNEKDEQRRTGTRKRISDAISGMFIRQRDTVQNAQAANEEYGVSSQKLQQDQEALRLLEERRIKLLEEILPLLGLHTEGEIKRTEAISFTNAKLVEQNDISSNLSDVQVSNWEKIQFVTRGSSEALQSYGDTFMDVAQMGSISSKKLFQIGKAASMGSAIINTAEGVTEALAAAPPPLNFIQAAAVAATGALQVATISSATMKAAATGFDGVVNKPTMFLTGEAGPESVQVTPLNPGMNQNGPQQGLTVNISSPLLDDSVVDSLIPKIEKAVGRGQSNLIIG